MRRLNYEELLNYELKITFYYFFNRYRLHVVVSWNIIIFSAKNYLPSPRTLLRYSRYGGKNNAAQNTSLTIVLPNFPAKYRTTILRRVIIVNY